MPSVSFAPNSTTTVEVRGDDSGTRNDTFELRTNFNNGQFQITQNNGAAVTVPASVTRINIYGDGGIDSVLVKSLPSTVQLTMTDVETLSIGDHKFAGILGNMTLKTNSGAPHTNVTFGGELDSQDHSVTLSSDSLAGLTQGTLDFSAAKLSALKITSGTGNDSFDVTGIKTDTIINTGGGANSIYVHSDLMSLAGKLTLNGGGGYADNLAINDIDSTLLNPIYTVTASSFSRSGVLMLPNVAAIPVSTNINYSGFTRAMFSTGGVGTPYVFASSTSAQTWIKTHNAYEVVVGNSTNGLGDIKVGLAVAAVSASGDYSVGGGMVVLVDQGSSAHSYTISHPYDGVAEVSRDDIPFVARGMASEALYAGSAADTFTMQDVDNSAYTPVAIDGGGGSDSLIGVDSGSTFTINGADSGFVGPSVSFAAVENLKGGAADDTFAFQTGGSLSGQIDGGGGINTLDFSALTGGVIVDLNLHTATTAAGGLLVGGGIFNILNVTGSQGDDLLRGDDNANELRGVAGNDILVGLDGNDHLIAEGVTGLGAETTRRCILIGGNGADVLEGSEGEDILIGGHFENNVDNNDTVLKAFLGVWAGPGDYTTRTRSLNQTGVLGGSYKVNDANIERQDRAVDTLTGNGGTDWYWIRFDDNDVITLQETGEKINGNV